MDSQDKIIDELRKQLKQARTVWGESRNSWATLANLLGMSYTEISYSDIIKRVEQHIERLTELVFAIRQDRPIYVKPDTLEMLSTDFAGGIYSRLLKEHNHIPFDTNKLAVKVNVSGMDGEMVDVYYDGERVFRQVIPRGMKEQSPSETERVPKVGDWVEAITECYSAVSQRALVQKGWTGEIEDVSVNGFARVRFYNGVRVSGYIGKVFKLLD